MNVFHAKCTLIRAGWEKIDQRPRSKMQWIHKYVQWRQTGPNVCQEKKNEILKLSQYIRLTRMKMTKADYSNIPVSVTQFLTGLDDYCNTCTTEEAPLSFKLWYQRDRYVTGRELSRCCHSFTKAVFAIAIDRAHGQNNIRGDGRPLGAIENPAALSH